MAWIAFLAVSLLVIGGTWAILVVLLAYARLYPPRLTPLKALFVLGRSGPADLGFHPQRMSFEVEFRQRLITLAGSLVTHPLADGRMVIVLHGFADSAAGASAWLPLLHTSKVNVLLLDLPGHGESDHAPTTAGYFERHSLLDVLHQLRQIHPDLCRHIAILGISMGAAVAFATALLPDSNIAGVIADCPYATFRRAVARHAWLFGLPGAIVQDPAAALIERVLNINYDTVAPINTIGQLPCPVLLIQAEKDLLISSADAQEMRNRLSRRPDKRNRAVVIPNAAHILGLSLEPDIYAQETHAFLGSIFQCD